MIKTGQKISARCDLLDDRNLVCVYLRKFRAKREIDGIVKVPSKLQNACGRHLPRGCILVSVDFVVIIVATILLSNMTLYTAMFEWSDLQNIKVILFNVLSNFLKIVRAAQMVSASEYQTDTLQEHSDEKCPRCLQTPLVLKSTQITARCTFGVIRTP